MFLIRKCPVRGVCAGAQLLNSPRVLLVYVEIDLRNLFSLRIFCFFLFVLFYQKLPAYEIFHNKNETFRSNTMGLVDYAGSDSDSDQEELPVTVSSLEQNILKLIK